MGVTLVHAHIETAVSLADQLLEHSEAQACAHKNSWNLREGSSVPPLLQEYTPFFNSSLAEEHGKLTQKFGKLKHVKNDLEEQLKSVSENPHSLTAGFFSSPERILQASAKVSEIDPEIMKLPAYINWAEEGKPTIIKYQGKCRSCYAFSGLASVESAILIKWE